LIPGWEDPLDKGMATHSNILAWWIPFTVEPGRLQSLESQRVGHDGAPQEDKKNKEAEGQMLKNSSYSVMNFTPATWVVGFPLLH